MNATPIALTFTVGLIDGTSTQKTGQIPAQSQFVDFLDDFLALPAPTPATLTSPALAGFATVTITSTSQFYVTALQYDGALLTTIAPAVIQ